MVEKELRLSGLVDSQFYIMTIMKQIKQHNFMGEEANYEFWIFWRFIRS